MIVVRLVALVEIGVIDFASSLYTTELGFRDNCFFGLFCREQYQVIFIRFIVRIHVVVEPAVDVTIELLVFTIH